MNNNFYIYVFLDTRKKGDYHYDDYKFDYEPFYVGKGRGRRSYLSKFDKLNTSKIETINEIISEGLKPLTLKLFENLTEEESHKKEIEIIEKIGRQIKNKGPLVNISKGGTGGDNISYHPNNKLIKKKMSNSQRGENNNFYGHKHTEETKNLLSEYASKRIGENNPFYGKSHSEETKKKIADKNRLSNLGSKNPFFGKKHSEETKKKISESMKKRKKNED